MMKHTSGVRCFLSPAPEFYVGEAVVNFSLLYELEMPKPWTPQREYHMYHEAMAQIELADQLGYHKVWEVEHHFFSASQARDNLQSYRPRRRKPCKRTCARRYMKCCRRLLRARLNFLGLCSHIPYHRAPWDLEAR
jgi:hypothetical protein